MPMHGCLTEIVGIELESSSVRSFEDGAIRASGRIRGSW